MVMDLFLQIVLLSIVEGLTEFLPVSSTAHLLVMGELLHFDEVPNQIFEVVIQLGAIIPVMIIYRAKVLKVACGVYSDRQSQDFLLNLFISFLPIAILGFLFHSFIKEVLFSANVLAVSMIIGGVVFLFADRIKDKGTTVDKLTYKGALVIGLIQALAIIPGVSRAGASIMGALFTGMNKEEAIEYSFFLAIPTIFAASFYDLYKNWDVLMLDHLVVISIGFITSFIASYIVVKSLILYVSRFGFKSFGYYRIVFGVVTLVIFL